MLVKRSGRLELNGKVLNYSYKLLEQRGISYIIREYTKGSQEIANSDNEIQLYSITLLINGIEYDMEFSLNLDTEDIFDIKCNCYDESCLKDYKLATILIHILHDEIIDDIGDIREYELTNKVSLNELF